MGIEEQQLLSLHGQAVEWRRHLHKHPELSFKETNTAAMIADLLEAWGLDVRRGVSGTGVVARLKGALPGRTVALRADIDALPIQDAKDVAYASQVPGSCTPADMTDIRRSCSPRPNIMRTVKRKRRGRASFCSSPAKKCFPAARSA